MLFEGGAFSVQSAGSNGELGDARGGVGGDEMVVLVLEVGVQAVVTGGSAGAVADHGAAVGAGAGAGADGCRQRRGAAFHVFQRYRHLFFFLVII